MEKNNLYIRISEFGSKHSNGFSYQEIKQSLELKDDSWEEKIIKSYIDNALKSGETNHSVGSYNGHSYSSETLITPSLDSMFFVIERDTNNTFNNHKFILKYDAYFNYVDYLEYREALISSKKAQRWAIFSIWIAVTSTILSIIFSYYFTLWQIKSPVEIDNKQITNILKSIDKTDK